MNRGPSLPSRVRARTKRRPVASSRARARTKRGPSVPSRVRARTMMPIPLHEQRSVASLPSSSANQRRSVASLPSSSAHHHRDASRRRSSVPSLPRPSASQQPGLPWEDPAVRSLPRASANHQPYPSTGAPRCSFTPEAQCRPAALSFHRRTRLFAHSHAPTRTRIPVMPWEDPDVRWLPRASAHEHPCPSMGGPGSSFPPTRQRQPGPRSSDEGPGPLLPTESAREAPPSRIRGARSCTPRARRTPLPPCQETLRTRTPCRRSGAGS
jgi:hypothetical protein